MPLLEEAAATRTTLQGERHPEALTALNNLAACFKAMVSFDPQFYERAESLYVQTLAARRAVLGNRHPDTLTSLNNLASCYQVDGSLEKHINFCIGRWYRPRMYGTVRMNS